MGGSAHRSTQMLSGLSEIARARANAMVASSGSNASIGIGGSGGGISRLSKLARAGPASIPVTFYDDGFLLFAGPVRNYDSPEALGFLNEVLGGNFPYELKQAYPHGAQFELHDRFFSFYLHFAFYCIYFVRCCSCLLPHFNSQQQFY
ncbi:hypothetical protein T492DRAFT_551142 [Pavlovales sp. CCMP2436]|nr:hypothetical protein T492DRAFT_551142 [Pavlovales sp. CCMP2436]